MKRAIITISESGRVNIPSNDVWMSEMELVELFGVIAPTLRAAIRAIYKSETLCPVTTQRCDLVTHKSWVTYYNLEVVVALTFRLNTYEASKIRQIQRELTITKNETCYSHERQVSIVLYVNIYQRNDRISFIELNPPI